MTIHQQGLNGRKESCLQKKKQIRYNSHFTYTRKANDIFRHFLLPRCNNHALPDFCNQASQSRKHKILTAVLDNEHLICKKKIFQRSFHYV